MKSIILLHRMLCTLCNHAFCVSHMMFTQTLDYKYHINHLSATWNVITSHTAGDTFNQITLNFNLVHNLLPITYYNFSDFYRSCHFIYHCTTGFESKLEALNLEKKPYIACQVGLKVHPTHKYISVFCGISYISPCGTQRFVKKNL